MPIPIYKVLAVIGYQKAGVSGSRGQIVSVGYSAPGTTDDWTEFRIGEGDGIYLHSRTKKPMCWWMVEEWLAEGDRVRLQTKVAEQGVGRDDDRTATLLFVVDPAAPVVTVTWQGLGYKNEPLLKGRLVEIARTSLADERRIRQVEPKKEEGFDETRVGAPPTRKQA